MKSKTIVLMCHLIILTIFSGCGETVYVYPKPFKVYLLRPCPKEKIFPNKDGSLGANNHRNLLAVTKCYKLQSDSYKAQLQNIKTAQARGDK